MNEKINNEIEAPTTDQQEDLDLFANELDPKINSAIAGAGCASTLGSGTSFSTAGCLCSFGCIACACTATSAIIK